jgi:lysophospholipase L1-like esterase
VTADAVAPPTRIDRDRPLRVHVIGSSVSVMVQPRHGPRDAGTYGEQLGPLLTDAGVPTTVTHAGRWFGQIHEYVSRYERDVRDPFPDVLVINFGLAECQSDLLPSRFVRHFTTWERTSRAGASFYRKRIAAPLWTVLRSYQRHASRLDRDRTHRLRPKRFVADYRRIINLVRKDCGSLVLLLDIDPPGDRVEHWLPGTRRRIRHYNELLAQVADGYDDHVRLVRASATLVDPATELPDGMHRTPAGHALTARLLADEILQWLDKAPS